MKLSIILAVYNEEKHLRECLSTLLAQNIKSEFEILVVDDGSKIPVKSLPIKELKDPKVRVLRLEHKGTAYSRNFGVLQSKGDIIIFLDGDMYFEPEFLSVLVEPLISGVSKGTFSSQEYVANWDNIWAKCWNWENGLLGKLRVSQSLNMTKDFRAILRSEFNKVGGFDDTGYTDTWSLSEKLGYKPTVTKAKYYHYNPDSLAELYAQAKWIGGRQRKARYIGKIIAIIRSLPITSLFVGAAKTLKFGSWQYLIFKLVYDWGILIGLLSSGKKK